MAIIKPLISLKFLQLFKCIRGRLPKKKKKKEEKKEKGFPKRSERSRRNGGTLHVLPVTW